MQPYWNRVLQERLTRRRALASTGAAATAAALLAACGGGGGSTGNDSGAAKTDLITRPVDTTKQAKAGGTIKDRTFGDPATLDILSPSTTHNSVGPMAYSSLVQIKPGYLKGTEGEIAGDVIESWEWAPDGLSVTMKMRQGMKFHNKPPINGRALDTDDVLFSWNRFTQKSSGRIGVANVADPSAPILSITATDSKTLVMKLKEPLVYALVLVSENLGGRPLIIPKETDSSYDIRSEVIGTGPFVMTNYTPSVSFSFKRNPDYYDKEYTLVDQVDMPIVPEYASALAQFKAGNIYSMGSGGNTPKVKSEDILSTKRDEPRIDVFQGDVGGGGPRFGFGWLPAGKSIFQDERVRQAISMAWDRDLYIDTFSNVSDFAKNGLPVETRWASSLAPSFEGWWLDPQDAKTFGPNAKYFQHDVAEAKKLLAAAGFPNGIPNLMSSYVTTGELGDLPKQAGVLDQMVADIGITTKLNVLDYATNYMTQYRDSQGQFEGWLYKSAGGGAGKSDPVGQYASDWWSKGGPTFFGFDVNGKGDHSGDPQVDSLIEKARVELNTDKRKALIADLQRYMAKAVYGLMGPGGGTGFTMAWPALSNFRVFQGSRLNYKYWVDTTKAPIAKT